MENVAINKEVQVTSVYFEDREELEAFPKRIEYGDMTFTFLKGGLQYLLEKGQEAVRIFSVTDGKAQYRIQLEPALSRWTLLDISQPS